MIILFVWYILFWGMQGTILTVVKMTYRDICDILGVSEQTPVFVCIGIIALVIGIYLLCKKG